MGSSALRSDFGALRCGRKLFAVSRHALEKHSEYTCRFGVATSVARCIDEWAFGRGEVLGSQSGRESLRAQ